MALIRLTIMDYEEALELARDPHSTLPKYKRVLLVAADLEGSGEQEKAESLVEAAVEGIDQKETRYFMLQKLIEELSRQGLFNLARRYLPLLPYRSRSSTGFNLVQELISRGSFDEALELARGDIIGVDCLDALLDIAEEMTSRDRGRALSLLGEALESSDDGSLEDVKRLGQIAGVCLMCGERKKAEGYIDRAEELLRAGNQGRVDLIENLVRFNMHGRAAELVANIDSWDTLLQSLTEVCGGKNFKYADKSSGEKLIEAFLEASRRVGGPPVEMLALELGGECYAALGRYERAGELFEEAIKRAEGRATPKSRYYELVAISFSLSHLSHRKALEVYLQALEEAKGIEDEEELEEVFLSLGHQDFRSSMGVEGCAGLLLEIYGAALELAGRLGDGRSRLEVLDIVLRRLTEFLFFADPGDSHRAVELVKEAVGLAQGTGLPLKWSFDQYLEPGEREEGSRRSKKKIYYPEMGEPELKGVRFDWKRLEEA